MSVAIGASIFGLVVRRERKKLGWSMERAAGLGGMSPVTWRRVERGLGIYSATYYGIDEAFQLPHGTALAVYSGEQTWPVRDAVTLDRVKGIFAPPPPSLVLRALVSASVMAGRMRRLGGVEPLDLNSEVAS